MVGDKQGGRVSKHEQRKLIEKYSDNAPLSNSLGDALRAALQQKGE
ncbi:hypothetical protein PACILC2_17020 [Paenibacillus cisolokensis]|uniref:Uncharacterized protein n=2 Tax=Paenibacillus cisolokensis TaxID=1658519 RepID=A0ABQ4N4Q8_9BACL|nr:hypothetical protein PACILC2_17020 [Paenibacillus cisolokensis]